MDQSTLVENRIADGQELIDELHDDGFDVTAACWVKTTDEKPWRLYVVSTVVDEHKRAGAYRAAHPALQRLLDPWMGISKFSLIGTKDPIARDIVDLQRRSPGRLLTRDHLSRVGNLYIDEVYVYPPIPDKRWRGIKVFVYPERGRANAFRVMFFPSELQALVGPDGQEGRVPRPAEVVVVDGCVAQFFPPENPDHALSQKDYEDKALEKSEAMQRD